MAKKAKNRTERTEKRTETTSESGTPSYFIRGYQPEGGAWAPTNSHRGRFGSWVAVGFLFAGFLLAGVALPIGPTWWLLGIAGVLMLIGAVLCAVTDIFTDVVLDDPHYELEEPHSTPLHKIKQRNREIAEREAEG